jgi:hypothetical protein
VSNFQLAENAIANEITRLQGLIDARDALRELGSLEQAIGEAGVRMEAARKDEAAAQAQLDALKQKVAAAKADSAAQIAAAKADVEAVRTKAQADADKIIADARKEAGRIVADAERATSESKRRAQVLSDALKVAGA